MSQKIAKTVAFFDLDHTVVDIDSFRLFLKIYYLYFPTRVFYTFNLFAFGLLRKVRLISLKSFKQRALLGLKGKSKKEIDKIGEEFFKSHLVKYIRSKAQKRIKYHKKKGNFVYLISASPDIYLKTICEYLNCDGYFCTKLEFKDEVFSGKINGEDCLGEEKAIRVKEMVVSENLQVKNIFAYSDHHADIPFLGCVGNAIAISPSEILKKQAIKKNWLIEYW